MNNPNLSPEELADMKRLFSHFMPLAVRLFARAATADQEQEITDLVCRLSQCCEGEPLHVGVSALLALCHLYFWEFWAMLSMQTPAKRVM